MVASGMMTRRKMMSACLAFGTAGLAVRLASAASACHDILPGISECRAPIPAADEDYLRMVQNERTNTIKDPYIIPKPILGMWNLIGDAGAALLARDQADLGPLFPNSVQVGAQSVPRCNVLFLYCALEASTRVAGQSFSMRDVIKAAQAHIAVLAADIPPALLQSGEFGQSLSARSDWPANIVITLNRNGEHFGRFFKELFSQMQ